MPDLYDSVSVDLEPGKTVYVVPTSAASSDPDVRKTRAAFVQGQPGPRMVDFVDGVSNTILILEVDPEAAVTWTQPKDWKFDPDDPMRSLGNENGRIPVVFADASIRQIETSVSPEKLKAFFTRAAADGGF